LTEHSTLGSPPRPVASLETGRPAPAAVDRVTIAVVLVLWLAYTATQTLLVLERLDEPTATTLGLLFGFAALVRLRQVGWSLADCHLRPRGLSPRGAAALGWLLVLWPSVLATGEWTGWDLSRALTHGLGGASQELFFRAALLPLLVIALGGRTRRALVVHALLFTVWHAGALLVTPADAIAGAVAILVVAFLAGLSWGWQTLHDRTVWWALGQHALLWVVGSMFLLASPS
jgi:membrane protease YdiL (CAAX protease family)